MGRPKKTAKERVPVGTRRKKLAAPGRKGYERRWVNDDPATGNIQRFVDGGYQFVDDPSIKSNGVPTTNETESESLDTRWSRHAGTTRTGDPMKAYLMEIPKRFYDADQKEKGKKIAQREQQIVDGSFDPGGLGQAGYVPESGIAIRANTRA